VKVLVTGGAGFIGGHVVDAHLREGCEVVVVDDLSTGHRRNLNPGARFYQMDIRDPAVADILAEERPEVLNHHAAQMDVRRSVADPLFDAEVNLIGFLNLLEAGVRSGLRRVIFASSGGTVYGAEQNIPAREGDSTAPICPYGVTKLAGERYLHYYRHAYGLEYAALRYANVYGPRQNPHGEAGVVAIFTGRLLAGEVAVINGDGTQTRDYVFVADVARANLLAARAAFSGEINIGSGVETDVNRLYAVLCAQVGVDTPPQYGPTKLGEQARSALAPQRAAEVLGWRPEVPLAEGLRQTVEYFRSCGAATGRSAIR
jgi:UDP-glucose 4-epimerase